MALSGHKPAPLTLELPPIKPNEEQDIHGCRIGDQGGLSCSSSLAIVVDQVGMDIPPISPLSISPSPSSVTRVDDEMSDVSMLSPYTPFMSLSPTTSTLNQTPIRDYELSISLSPSNSTLNLDPFALSPGSSASSPVDSRDGISPLSKLGFRAKAKGLEFKLPNLPLSQYHLGHGLRSPVDTIRQQDVFPLPSPMARDLRRRVEHEHEVETDVATSFDEGGYGFSLSNTTRASTNLSRKIEPSCLGLDLGVFSTPSDEGSLDLDSYVIVKDISDSKHEQYRGGPETDELSVKIMQASLAHSASAELVSSPGKSQSRRTSPPKTIDETVSKSPSNIYPRKSIPLPNTHLEPSFSVVSLGKLNRATPGLSSLPISSGPSTPEGPLFKRDALKQGSHSGGAATRFLNSAPLSPSPRRKPVYQDTYAVDLMQLRMHGYVLFPNRFPKDYLLEIKFAQRYYVETELGAGGYGFVLSAQDMLAGDQVAVKFIERRLIPNRGLVRDYKNDVVPLEAVALQLAEHPGVVRFRGLYQDDLYFYLVSRFLYLVGCMRVLTC